MDRSIIESKSKKYYINSKKLTKNNRKMISSILCLRLTHRTIRIWCLKRILKLCKQFLASIHQNQKKHQKIKHKNILSIILSFLLKKSRNIILQILEKFTKYQLFCKKMFIERVFIYKSVYRWQIFRFFISLKQRYHRIKLRFFILFEKWQLVPWKVTSHTLKSDYLYQWKVTTRG